MKVDLANKADTVAARRASCGYRIQLTCASCVHCQREYHGRFVESHCDYNGFNVNLDRGLCEYFDHIGKYKS